MSTFMAKKETLERKWYVIDAANKPLGKTAVAAANILRGKHRPEFTPTLTAVNSLSLSTQARLFSPARSSNRNTIAVTPVTSAV